jgi:FixJ family two-component response regulator
MKSDYKAIAIVDDDEDIVNLFIDLLRESGYDVFGFTNPLVLLYQIATSELYHHGCSQIP